ncbi:hypothetical protein IPJ70_01575 [Candidatus Campbellbacteria bacterium]|nr:MAG: hypothetical protein IPJ70_01575 [Candidatus Campbellbacteria bacterium]
MKKYVTFFVTLVLIGSFALPAFAQTDTEVLTAQIQSLKQELIKLLLVRVEELKAQLSELQAAQVGASTGVSTLIIESVPLLSGGTAHAGTSVPVSYLYIRHTGKENAKLEGFWVKQNGSASTKAVIGFTSVDDKEIVHGSIGGNEGTAPFKDGSAFVPMNITFTPRQERLFTIRAVLTDDVSSYTGTQLKIDVTGIESNAQEKGTFPIRGTTWTIAY